MHRRFPVGVSMSPMFRRIPEHLDGATRTTISRIARTELLVVGEIGMLPPGSGCRRSVHCLIGVADSRRGVVVISNLHLSGIDTIVPKFSRRLPSRAVCSAAVPRPPRDRSTGAHKGSSTRQTDSASTDASVGVTGR